MDNQKMNGIGKHHIKPHSIYDYPEHLNPFYQDENHKRLRFWALKKNKDGRGNSFSMSNLRDLWSFKTFTLKKKSSTLGINKTSESPPPLRKYGNECLYDSNYNTYDPRYRQTIGSAGSGSTTDVAFQRNVPYRATMSGAMNSSAKSYDTQSDIVFNRNESYRNTIQHVSHGQRYNNNNASVTPVLNQRRITSSASQSSLRSTNPFDDDYENNENTSPNQQDTIIENGGVVKGPVKRPYKKKRRAPPPPVVHQYVPRMQQEESDSSNNLRIDEVELKIVEEESPCRETPSKDELPTISMITAEIETLYRDLEDDEKKLTKVSTECQTQSKVIEKRDVHNDSNTERNNLVETVLITREVKRQEPIVFQTEQEEKSSNLDENRNEKLQDSIKTEEIESIKEIVTQTKSIEMKIHEEKEIIEPIAVEKVEQPAKVHFKEPTESEIHIYREASVGSTVSHDSEKIQREETPENEDKPEPVQLEYTKSYTIEEPLMIVESPSKPVPSTFPRRSEGNVTAFEIKYKQLKDGTEPRFRLERRRSLKEKERKEFMQRALNLDRSQSVDIRRNLDEEFENYNKYNNPNENGDNRRKSVKEIIDSINRNQSLLQATNYTPLEGKYDYNNVNYVGKKPVAPPRSETIKIEVEKYDDVELRHPPQIDNGRGSFYDNVPDMLEHLEGQATTFKKCSPPRNNSTEKFEWNPVPKPRRSRNFSEEREIPRSEALRDYY
uniref:CSON007460 protein n=1 Tax=Culicoides sonorensis TaxID=179676 RepID=A0A336M0B8_CULSO